MSELRDVVGYHNILLYKNTDFKEKRKGNKMSLNVHPISRVCLHRT